MKYRKVHLAKSLNLVQLLLKYFDNRERHVQSIGIGGGFDVSMEFLPTLPDSGELLTGHARQVFVLWERGRELYQKLLGAKAYVVDIFEESLGGFGVRRSSGFAAERTNRVDKTI